ncbi:hypothetical protein E6W39_02785 [Kitasatospora acidiphila]|uniref:HNH endonuclease n=1 Tax=Kitasatospora acidiphila TaxID=2567942 RepID=A0A540VX69_9ACTN|nr:hypothetical protein [Kitasatospora acidiphila]TQF01358.1 hypothetical protein E6W39_02785 [Kitasatospora acidiphila]
MRSLHRRFATGGTALAVTLASGALVLAPTAHAAVRPHATAALCSQAYLPLPDPNCTPGVLNPDVTQDTIDSTICVSGWTATIRPSTSYTNRLKAQGISDYGYTDTNMSDYEEDHFIPLELGGSPTDPQNLWPEPHYSTGSGGTSYTKDAVENKLKKAVCSGTVALTDAQNAIATDWTTALSSLGL